MEATRKRMVAPVQGLCGACELPGSRDLSLMALALSANAEGTSEILRCSRLPEAEAMVAALERLGLAVERDGDGVKVTGGALRQPDGPLDAGGSEVLFACLAGLLAGAPFQTRIAGDAGCAEDAEGVVEALRALGVRPSLPVEGVLPLTVGGSPVTPGRHRIGAPSTAVKCAMFLAGLGAEGDVQLFQDAAGDTDLEILFRAAGGRLAKGKVEGEEGHCLSLAGPVAVQPALHDIPGDPDAALFLLFTAAALRKSDLTLVGVGNDWKTRRLLELLRRINAGVEIQMTRSASGFPTRRVRVQGSELRATKIAGAQAALFLHELPFLAVVGACAGGETVIRDAQALREGGADCIGLVVENLRRMQARVGEMPDGLVVQGGIPLQGAEVDAGGDARVAMAFALAGLVAEGETAVLNPGPFEPKFSEILDCLSAVAQEKGR